MAEPAYSFSIPSIEDDTPLDCRVYHPKRLSTALSDTQHGGRGIRGVVIAHPYAPLGGCYDDPVVLSVTETLLEQGFIVGTFNFRGAEGSSGRTTWSGKAELDDYTSFAGFMAYYLHVLRPHEDFNRLEPIPSADNQLDNAAGPTLNTPRNTIQLLLGGYSYGSLILARLQPSQAIFQRLQLAEMGTAGAEIFLRARTLANQTKSALEGLYSPASPRGRQLSPVYAATSPTKRIGVSPITVGGEETDPSNRRRSRDSRRSTDLVRKSIEAPHRIKAHLKGSSSPKVASANGKQIITPTSPGADTGPIIKTRYLIISPVLLPFTQMLCPPGPPSLISGFRKRTPADVSAGASFLKNPTLAIFGSTDVFSSSKRLNSWSENMSRNAESTFECDEIQSAGHFWREPGVMQALQGRIAAWAGPS